MLETRQLRYFAAVAEELHFGRAAARLHIAQPALSRQIQKIEEQIGARLFERTQRRVELTPAGEVLLARAQHLIEEIARAEQAARRADAGEIGTLVLGFIHSSTYGLLPGILQRFRRLRPDVQLDLKEMSMAEQANALARGTIDIGLTRPSKFSSDVETLAIFKEGFLAAVPAHHALASSASTPLSRLANEPFIMFPSPTSPLFNASIMRMCEKAGFVPKVTQTATQVHTVIGLVSANMGVAIVPATAKNLHIAGVAFLRIEDDPPPVHVVLAWARQHDTPAMRAFREIALDVARRLR